MNKSVYIILLFAFFCITKVSAQTEATEAPSTPGATRIMFVGQTSVRAVMDSAHNDINNVSFTALFLGQLSSKLFFQSEVEINTSSGVVDVELEHLCMIWI